MFERSFWTQAIETAWRERSIVWLMGVRRVGKTVLCRSLPEVEYLDCELPRVRRELADPEAFLGSMRGKRVVLDEVHRLPNPAELLKIAADHFPQTRIVATGSSTLGASARFRDTLAGRKRELWLPPMILADVEAAGMGDLRRRFLRGGLPSFFLAKRVPERDYVEWMEAYFAKDIMELFRLERRQSFLKFFELLMLQSGGIFEASKFAQPCEISRTTVTNYLSVLEATFVVHLVRPFARHRQTEIVAAPRVYAFDTGFVAHHRGWESLRDTDLGTLWEHFVLNELHARLQSRRISYWRTKHGAELDFVISSRKAPPSVIECKWSADAFEPGPLKLFRKSYPRGANFVVAADVERSFSRDYDGTRVRFLGLPGLVEALA